MNNQVNDYTKLLGQYVKFLDVPPVAYKDKIEPVLRHGLIIGVIVPMQGYEKIVGNEVLFLETDKSDPYYISGDLDFEITGEPF